MRVTCDQCSLTYDDIDHWTYCPHTWFPPGWFVGRVLSGDEDAARYVDLLCQAIAVSDQVLRKYMGDDLSERTDLWAAMDALRDFEHPDLPKTRQ